MASINDMLDDITEEILQREPFDQRTEVIVDSSLNYGLDLYQIVTGNETFDNNREKVQSDGIQFIEHQNAEEEEEENSISSEMNTFNQFFNEAVTQLQNNNNENVNSQKRPPSVDERRESEGHFSLRKIEAEFSKSDQKLKLLEKIKTIGNEKGWYKKVDNFTAKLMNDNVSF
uniref:Uncharacterized protein n=1 Tax=Panagrolaimus superbus TaxID=310955 RepID=A0A914Y2S0_9BILA